MRPAELAGAEDPVSVRLQVVQSLQRIGKFFTWCGHGKASGVARSRRASTLGYKYIAPCINKFIMLP